MQPGNYARSGIRCRRNGDYERQIVPPHGILRLAPPRRAVQRFCATATESDVQHALREATVLLRGGILKGGNL